MPDATGPILLVVGGDSKRLQWLTHHVSSHWPSAQVTTAPAAEPAARLRDREAIKLIFKSGYTTRENSPGGPQHGTGMSLVRRYIHEAGGKIALASLLGHETRFKISLPPLADAEAGAA